MRSARESRVCAGGRALGLAIVIAAAALEPLAFVGSFAGDAQVHLVFAENASQGRFFEFNPGERVSGETSPGYMLIGAALFRVLPARYVPVALKLIGLAGWYGLCWLVYRVGRRAIFAASEDGSKWALAAAILAALLPGSAYNATVGMENGLFAAGVWWWIDCADRGGWFDGTPPRNEWFLRPLVLAFQLGLLCWLRPEGGLVLLLALALRARHTRGSPGRMLGEFCCAVLVGASALVFQHAFTGDWIATSILSRRLAALQESVWVGPVALDPTFAKRLLFYAPLTALCLVGRRIFIGSVGRFVTLSFAGAFVFYTLAGGPHLARYVIFVMPALAIGAAAGTKLLWESRRPGGRVIAVGALSVFVACCAGEAIVRRRQYSQALLALAMQAPARRLERSAAMLSRAPASAGQPLVLATEAIQQRYELDSRVVVRSIDGRTDRSLFQFVRGANLDAAAYLRFVGARLLDSLRFPDAARPGSLADRLRPSPVGSAMVIQGLSFSRLDPFTYWIQPATPGTTAGFR